MWSLADFGRATEQRVGPGRFAVILVVTGVVGFLASDLWYTWRFEPARTAGASGGLFGLMGALIGSVYARKDPAWKDILIRMLVYAAVFALVVRVNNAAHAGGFLAGLPLGYLFEKERRPRERDRVFQVIGIGLVIVSIASIALSARSIYWRLFLQQEQRMASHALEPGERAPAGNSPNPREVLPIGGS
jgi:hypothetical protein